MTRAPNLGADARSFANELTDLLNKTVTRGVRLSINVARDGQTATVGTISEKLNERRPLKLDTASPFVHVWLDLVFGLYHDATGYLTVRSSVIAVLTGSSGEDMLFHYDYERDKERVADAHLQVCAKSKPLSDLFAALERPKDQLQRLHFPVGGRRYRPALEDILEFLIREQLVVERPGALEFLAAHRDRFRRLQLKAAVRNDPDAAMEQLRELGFVVAEPADRPARPPTPLQGKPRRVSRRR